MYSRIVAETKARQVLSLHRFVQSLEHQRMASTRSGIWDEASEMVGGMFQRMQMFETAVRKDRDHLKRELGQAYEDHYLKPFVDLMHGIGNTLYLIDALLPVTIAEFKGPYSVYRYLGLDPEGALRPTKGHKLHYNRLRKSIALVWLVDPIIKTGGPYRAVYDERKAKMTALHPAMPVEGCPTCKSAKSIDKEERAEKEYTRERTGFKNECAALGGIHYKKDHLHKDAIRITAKAVLKDAWRSGHGLAPLVSPIVSETPAHAAVELVGV